MEYHKAHKMKMLLFSELLEEIVSNEASLADEQKEEIWVRWCERITR